MPHPSAYQIVIFFVVFALISVLFRWVFAGIDDEFGKTVKKNLEKLGHRQLNLDGIRIDSRRKRLIFREGVESFALSLAKVQYEAGKGKYWQLFLELPDGERRIITPDNLDQLISDTVASDRDFRERTLSAQTRTIASVA